MFIVYYKYKMKSRKFYYILCSIINVNVGRMKLFDLVDYFCLNIMIFGILILEIKYKLFVCFKIL